MTDPTSVEQAARAVDTRTADLLARCGVWWGEAPEAYDVGEDRWCWLGTDGAGSAWPIDDEITLALIGQFTRLANNSVARLASPEPAPACQTCGAPTSGGSYAASLAPEWNAEMEQAYREGRESLPAPALDVDAYLDSISVMTAEELRRRWPVSAARLVAESVPALDVERLVGRFDEAVDRAREYAREYAALRPAPDALREAAQAVVDYWDTFLLGRDQRIVISERHAALMAALRSVLAAAAGGGEDRE